MTVYVNTWGLYPLSPNSDKKYEYVHPDDLDLFVSLFPYGKVFFCISEDNDYICLSFGEIKARVKPELYRKIEGDGYLIGDIVEVLNGSSEGKEATIKEMNWHHKKKKIMYELEVDGKIKSRRYWAEDFKQVNKV